MFGLYIWINNSYLNKFRGRVKHRGMTDDLRCFQMSVQSAMTFLVRISRSIFILSYIWVKKLSHYDFVLQRSMATY